MGFSAGSGGPPAGSGSPPAGSGGGGPTPPDEFTADSGVTADSSTTADNPPGSTPPTPPGSSFTADSSITADSSLTVDNPPGTGAYYPNVPPMPGVPQLARLQTAAQVAAAGTQSGIMAALAAQLGLPVGSIFGSNALYAGLGLTPLDPDYAIVNSDGTEVVIDPDSTIELDVSADSAINTHPIELGQFEAYNRVQQPVAVRLLLACQGRNMDYTQFVSTLKSLREGTQTVTLALPNDSYDNMALKAFSYSRRSERGAITIWADTQWMEERSTNVVVTAPPTTEPQGAAQTDLGAVSPATPDAMQQAAISNPPITPVLAPPQYTDPQQVAAGITNPLGLPPIGNGGTPPSLAAW